MKRIGLATVLLTATAITSASAQDLSVNCDRLSALLDEANADIRADFADAGEIALRNDDAECLVYVERIAATGVVEGEAAETASESFSDSETITQQVEITTQAIVEGDVLVRVPQPDVAVDQAGAEIAITDAPASVSVDQGAAEIVVRQAQPRILVSMPTPTITIEQDAPEIIITMPRPGVSVEDAEPTVEVVMAEPVIRVTQAEPQLDVNVRARFAEAGEEIDPEQDFVQSRTELVDREGNAVDSDVVEDFQLTQADSTVTMTRPETSGEQVTYTSAEPVVRFESAEPVVEFAMDGEPTIEYRQIGEIRVTLRDPDAEEQMDQAQAPMTATDGEMEQAEAPMAGTDGEMEQAEAPLAEEAGETETAARPLDADATEADAGMTADAATEMDENEQRLARSPEADGMTTGMREITAAELSGMSVQNMQGETLGELDRVVDNNGRMFGVVEHGGFLGFGETEVALPLDRLMLDEDRILLQGLTEAELEALPEYDVRQDLEVDGATPLQLMDVRG